MLQVVVRQQKTFFFLRPPQLHLIMHFCVPSVLEYCFLFWRGGGARTFPSCLIKPTLSSRSAPKGKKEMRRSAKVAEWRAAAWSSPPLRTLADGNVRTMKSEFEKKETQVFFFEVGGPLNSNFFQNLGSAGWIPNFFQELSLAGTQKFIYIM